MAAFHSARLVGVIGDMVESRSLSPRSRARAQHEFAALVRGLNTKYRAEIASRFVVTLGDECQGLLTRAEVIPDLIWHVESEFGAREIRIGVGYGILHTPIQRTALNIDGPVMHEARAALTFARDQRLLGGVFRGFGSDNDVLFGFAQILRFMRANWTEKQRQVVGLLRDGLTQAKVADRLSVSKQTISEHAVAAGCDAYLLGEHGWKRALAIATTRPRSRA